MFENLKSLLAGERKKFAAAPVIQLHTVGRPQWTPRNYAALAKEGFAGNAIGYAMVEQVLREVDPDLSFRAVHATLGKQARAEPVAALYEQGRVSHVGGFAKLEDELCSAIGEGQKSPDRLDALVWAVSDLMLRRRTEPRVRIL